VSAPARTRRALSYEETERRLAPVLARVPITRVYDATPLDWIGLPVWSAVTPLALDLTVHAGKGPTAAAARISATMEAIERVSAEQVDERRLRVASYAELRRERDGALDPELFDLPFGTRYRPDLPLSWLRGRDLLEERDVWVALDLAVSPAREGICAGVETNGLAAGNDRTEAVVHGLLELIERDALAHERFTRRYVEGEPAPIRVLDRESLPAEPAAWLQQLDARGLHSVICDLSHDLDVPVFRAGLYEPGFPGREGQAATFDGLGADLDPGWALMRAICEAVQSHTVTVLGARDTIEDGAAGLSLDKRLFLRRLTTPTVVQPFPTCAGELPDDRHARLRILLARIAAAGLKHCVVVDLTRADLGVPVVRVLVPGLAAPFGQSSRRPALRLLRTLL
jgi:ribosomal protein S12 methylthiotransferase accessory factor